MMQINNSQRQTCFLVLLCTVFFLSLCQSVFATDPALSAVEQDYSLMVGEWQRTDGSYLLTVTNVQQDGRATVNYFNPNPIHVERALISTRKDLLKLFVQLQDKGYEGSTYTLYYYAEKDALAGFYYQATLDRTYQVIFMRKSN